MPQFNFLPTEVRFYDWFEKATANLLEGARALLDLLENYEDIERKVDRIIEIEHNGDFIVHEVMHLLPRTLITPIDSTDIQDLIKSIDDAIDSIEDTARRLLIYDVREIKEPARKFAKIIMSGAQELNEAVVCLRNKQDFNRLHAHIVEMNTLENNGDRVLYDALNELVAHREEIFDLIRWKEIYEYLEATTDRIEDAADVLEGVTIANA
ncbi:MAG: DUF47 family protein [Anaerolineae bacterium]